MGSYYNIITLTTHQKSLVITTVQLQIEDNIVEAIQMIGQTLKYSTRMSED
jgi:hypothetical protein